MDGISRIIERSTKKAIDQGAFDDLPGKGKSQQNISQPQGGVGKTVIIGNIAINCLHRDYGALKKSQVSNPPTGGFLEKKQKVQGAKP